MSQKGSLTRNIFDQKFFHPLVVVARELGAANVIHPKYSKHWKLGGGYSKILDPGLNHGLCLSLFMKTQEQKSILNWLENTWLKSRLLYWLRFQVLLMYKLICHKPISHLPKWLFWEASFKCLQYLGCITLGAAHSDNDMSIWSSGGKKQLYPTQDRGTI